MLIFLEKAKESVFSCTCRTLDIIFIFYFPSNSFDYIKKKLFPHPDQCGLVG